LNLDKYFVANMNRNFILSFQYFAKFTIVSAKNEIFMLKLFGIMNMSKS
jgi:hypothetical protein